MKTKRTPRLTPKNYTTERKVVSNGVARNPAAANLDWPLADKKELYDQVFARVRHIKSRQLTRRFELYTYKQAYDARFGPALMAALYSPTTRNPSAGLYAISANIIKSCIDTACARIAKEKPRAFVLPNKGDYRLKKKARQLTKFLDGAMAGSGFYAASEEAFRDACLYDGGNILIHAEDGKLCATALKTDEVIIDQVDGMYNDPKEIHWVHPEPRRKLLQKYPAFAKEIDMARSLWRGELSHMGQADLVEVVRSWKRPSAPDAKDGRYAVTIGTATLEEGPWNRDYLPIARFHWTQPTYGPFGDGIAKELFGLQRAVSDILRGIVKSIRMFAVPRVWVSKMAGVTSETISNEISVNTYAGERPVFDTPPAASADIYQFVQWIIDYAYKQIGLSQMTAQSEKPAGLNSGVALRTYQDVETQRFAIIGQRWERFYMQCARLFIATAEDLYKDKKELSVNVPGRGFIETIDWKDVSLAQDQYDIQVWPTDILPETPEGKFQAVQEWMNSGFMPREVAIQQMRMPVLNDWIDRETAALENTERCLSSILDKGKYIAPDPIGNIGLALSMAQSAYLVAQDEDVGPTKIDLLLRFIARATEIKAANDAPPAPAPGAAPVVGQAPAPPPAPLAPAGAGPVQAAV